MAKILSACITLFILTVAGCSQIASRPTRIERISAEQLRAMLGRPEVVVVDVRSPSDWDRSRSKIKGAVRESLSDISAWVDKYPRQKTIVFYCA